MVAVGSKLATHLLALRRRDEETRCAARSVGRNKCFRSQCSVLPKGKVQESARRISRPESRRWDLAQFLGHLCAWDNQKRVHCRESSERGKAGNCCVDFGGWGRKRRAESGRTVPWRTAQLEMARWVRYSADAGAGKDLRRAGQEDGLDGGFRVGTGQGPLLLGGEDRVDKALCS